MFFQSDNNNLYSQQFILFYLLLLFRSTTNTSFTVPFAHILHTSFCIFLLLVLQLTDLGWSLSLSELGQV